MNKSDWDDLCKLAGIIVGGILGWKAIDSVYGFNASDGKRFVNFNPPAQPIMQRRQISAANLRPYMPNHGDKGIVTIKNVNGLLQGTVSLANAGGSAQEPHNVSDNVPQFLQTPGSWLEVTFRQRQHLLQRQTFRRSRRATVKIFSRQTKRAGYSPVLFGVRFSWHCPPAAIT